MLINPRIVSTAAALAITCVVSAAAYYYKHRNTEINEVMIFCKLQYNAHKCFDKLVSFIEAAKNSVHVCMPGIHNPAIQGRLVELIKKKNIKARIILDHAGYNESTDFLLQELKDVGAEIRSLEKESVNKMQHKFCLVDDEVLMTGTLNWGNDRSSDHWNYVFITNNTQLVEPVKTNFYQMWSESSSETSSATISDKQNDSNETVNLYQESFEYIDHFETEKLKRTPTPELLIL
ncbi:unnamed protein product [Diatraea saccharalis]|uniref:Mitochondrial cardiolipin hydrolase n=1 Tax=Diatraea saccharalis TaxID=40085 RepID=A0A9N9WG78_9NEOP|nr:unnamed protein product [Diatraea saccharalis]